MAAGAKVQEPPPAFLRYRAKQAGLSLHPLSIPDSPPPGPPPPAYRPPSIQELRSTSSRKGKEVRKCPLPPKRRGCPAVHPGTSLHHPGRGASSSSPRP